MFAMLPLALQIGGAISGAVGSYYAAKSQRTELNYQASIANVNARIAELGAQSELQRGQREEQAVRLKTARLKSAQRVALAANGVDLGEGSAAEIQASTDYMGEIDAETVASNAVRSAWGYRTQAMNYQNDALMKTTAASNINPGRQAASSLLGSAGQVASSWYSLNKQGAFKGTFLEMKG